MTGLSNGEVIGLFKQHLKVLRERREAALAHIAASQEMIERSRALIAQTDEQINWMERELGWFGRLTARSERAL